MIIWGREEKNSEFKSHQKTKTLRWRMSPPSPIFSSHPPHQICRSNVKTHTTPRLQYSSYHLQVVHMVFLAQASSSVFTLQTFLPIPFLSLSLVVLSGVRVSDRSEPYRISLVKHNCPLHAHFLINEYTTHQLRKKCFYILALLLPVGNSILRGLFSQQHQRSINNPQDGWRMQQAHCGSRCGS